MMSYLLVINRIKIKIYNKLVTEANNANKSFIINYISHYVKTRKY